MTTQSSPARTPQNIDGHRRADPRWGDSPPRPDGTLKVRGEFTFSSDLSAEDKL
ncbi:hypothetical protein ACIPWY_09490 [Streptomyces sp. NPDC090032]|uniref:hypothetical protein n=1 Tax=unclassified Streptomyces TaxID=2593676 RepID=UPI00372405F5